MRNLTALEVTIIKSVSDGCCTYCHRRFGDRVWWHHKVRFLAEEQDHVLPKVLGGLVIVPCCSLCNNIKGSLIFDSLAEIQDYCLDQLLAGHSIVIEYARGIRIERAVQLESISSLEIAEFLTEQLPEENRIVGSGYQIVLEHAFWCEGCNQCTEETRQTQKAARIIEEQRKILFQLDVRLEAQRRILAKPKGRTN